MTKRFSRVRVAFLTTHPIQYHAAWFRALANEQSLDFHVLYCHNPPPEEQGTGFDVAFSWDLPLLEGYQYAFLQNVASKPTLNEFAGLDAPQLRTLIATGQYDAVVINGWHYKAAWQAIRACWKHKVPVLVRSDSHLYTPRHPMKRLLKAMPYRWFIPRLDGCLPVGQWSSDYFLHFGASRDRLFVVPHVVDPRFERESVRLAQERDVFRRDWGLELDHIVFLFVGKFVQKKRPADFIQAIARAKQVNPNIEGLMVGDGPLRPACEQLARELQAPVCFAGFLNQSRIVKAFVAADALVLPSDGGETWGVVVNEAMSCGRPAIVSDQVGCAPDLIVIGRTGFVFRLGDVDDLAARMVECAANKWHVQRMGTHARAKMSDHSLEKAVQRLSHAVHSVVAAA